MKEYNFEYTSQSNIWKLGGAMYVVLMALVFTTPKIGLTASMILCGLSLILTYLVGKKIIKEQGRATVYHHSIKFDAFSEEKIMNLDEIKSFKIEESNGSTILTLRFKDDDKFKILASDWFCDPTEFQLFCNELEEFLNQYEPQETSEPNKLNFEPVQIMQSSDKVSTVSQVEKMEIQNPNYSNTNNPPRKIIREKTLFEQKWMPYFLVAMTLAIVIFLIATANDEKSTPATIFTSLGIIISMWFAFLKAKTKK